MNRKSFLRVSTTAGLLAGISSFPLESFALHQERKLTILHTNDQHSRIEPFPFDGGKYQGLGGFAQRAKLIKKIRAVEKNVLLLDSGDIWQGTPYFNMYGGELEFKLMSEMGYDASTLGNHDFDAGEAGFVKQLPHSNFPFINCNYNFSESPLNRKILPYTTFQFEDFKVGVLGVGIELAGLVPKDLYGNIRYEDPIQHANKTATLLKHEIKCDLVICLSHLGYQYNTQKVSDVVLAEQSENIDLILGGHTHTFMPAPEERKNKNGKKILINQVGWAGIYLGKIDFHFEKQGKATAISDFPKLISS